MPKFRTIDELQSYIQRKVLDGLVDEVADVVKKEESEAVEREVYDKYSPQEYERRGNSGGLSDVDNMKTKIASANNNEVSIWVENITTGNPEYGKGGNEEEFISPTIEAGHGEYGYYDYPTNKRFTQPRRFQQATIDALNENKEHVKVLKEYLKSQGIKVK